MLAGRRRGCESSASAPGIQFAGRSPVIRAANRCRGRHPRTPRVALDGSAAGAPGSTEPPRHERAILIGG
nr:MAG TPA: hypothetical protein [Caudoviricetes sp.]